MKDFQQRRSLFQSGTRRAAALVLALCLGVAAQANGDDAKTRSDDPRERRAAPSDARPAGGEGHPAREREQQRSERSQQDPALQIERVRENSARQAAKAREKGNEARAQQIEARAQKRIERLEHAQKKGRVDGEGVGGPSRERGRKAAGSPVETTTDPATMRRERASERPGEVEKTAPEPSAESD